MKNIDYQKMYQDKRRTLQECLDMIQSGDHICFGKDCNEPLLFCQQLHTIAPRVEGVTVLKGRSSDFGFLQNEGIKGHILTQSAFFAKGWERPLELGNVTFVPNDLRDQPFWYNAANPRNTYIAAVTPMDENGNFQVNLSQMWERDIDPLSCKKIILEVNKNLKTSTSPILTRSMRPSIRSMRFRTPLPPPSTRRSVSTLRSLSTMETPFNWASVPCPTPAPVR